MSSPPLSVGQLEADPELSLLLANEALESARTPEAVDALRQALTESSVRLTYRPDEGTIGTVAFSPDGTQVLTASYEGAARIWNSNSSEDPLVLMGHTDLIQSGGFSPDGTRAVTASFDGTARIWEIGDRRRRLHVAWPRRRGPERDVQPRRNSSS